MAHGGSDEWNSAVTLAVAPLAEETPTAVAYGMADPYTMQAALDSLRDRGVGRVAVVRIFLSGESFLPQTKYFLGLSPTPPERFVLMGPAAGDPEARAQLRHEMEIATHFDGLLDSPQVAPIMAERANTLSSEAAEESVLIVAHGMGETAENDRVLRTMRAVATQVALSGFASVEIATLREDWAVERRVAEANIRDYVRRETSAGRRVIVLPMRLSGFGPYANVLKGLDYQPGQGLLPHESIADWVTIMAARVSCTAGWGPAIGACPPVVAAPASRER